VREVGRHDAVQRLVVEDRRDAEAGLFDQVALDGVDRLRDRLGRLVAEQAKPADVPDAVP
jgi:hypothetical protein